MSIDIDIELQKTFHETVMQHAQNVLRNGSDWSEADEIMKRRDQKRQDLNTAYDGEYEQRVAAEHQRLLNAPDKLTFEHPAPKGVVQDNYAALTRQAEQNVINGHQSDLQSSRDGQQQEMDQLMAKAQSRNEQQGVARDAFTRAHDRRAPERQR